MESVNIVVVGVNSKYIHSCLAAWYLKESLADLDGIEVDVREYTINNQLQVCLEDIYIRRPHVVAFSCYIWNIDFIRRLAKDLKKILPETYIVAGGPEVSYEECYDDRVFDFIIKKEGEIAFKRFVQNFVKAKNKGEDFDLSIQENCVNVDLSEVKSPYTRQMLENIENRILYYESSRGCPFNCSYCLSSAQKGLTFLPLETVYKDLLMFARFGIRLIKFVDRTFNCNKERAMAIWRFITVNRNEFENIVFHFEVAGDLFDRELISLLNDMPRGQIQLEVGIQSANEKTHREIGRVTDLEKVYKNVSAIVGKNNIHLHLDLIAGLPGEDFYSIKHSFNTIYALRPHMFQLGFLKLLKGTALRKRARECGVIFRDYAPYEVLRTRELSFDDIACLKGIEDVLDRFYNSSRFHKTFEYIIGFFESAFDFYFSFYTFLNEKSFWKRPIKADECYNYLYEFLEMNTKLNSIKNINLNLVKECLKFDYLASNNTANFPKCIKDQYDKNFKNIVFKRLQDNDFVEKFLPIHKGLSAKEIYKRVHIDRFSYQFFSLNCSSWYECEMNVLFDYSKKDGVTGLYRYVKVL